MRKIQIGTILFEDEKTTEIYNQYKDYFRVEVEDEWLNKIETAGVRQSGNKS